MTYQHILYEVSDKIATITLNRPDRMNAWTAIMERDVRHAMEAASADDNVRVIVLTGAGRAFCAGADMEALKEIDPNDIRRGENTPFDMNRRAGLADPLRLLSGDSETRDRHAERRHRRHRPGPRALLRPALRRRQHRLHDRVRAPRADRRARHQLDAAAHRRPCQRARSADVRAGVSAATKRCASGWSTGSIRRTSCASRPMPMRAISLISSRPARYP